ncbi:MAG: hypothetical protein RH942_08200 [Kiloniellaceae bacterium]
MFNDKVLKGLQTSILALTVAGPLANSALADSGLVGDAAAQLAAQSNGFQATTANIDVVPAKMAGGCPQSFAFNVRLGAQAPGTLAYKIVTEDGRESQTFEAEAAATDDGLFIARSSHRVALVKGDETDPSFVVFDEPERVKPLREPDFFERLFGTGPAADEDDAQALRDLAFMVKVVAPNEVASGFDRHSVTCEEAREARIIPIVAEDQRDPGDRDRGRGRDDSSSDGGGRDGRGGRDAAGGPAGAR